MGKRILDKSKKEVQIESCKGEFDLEKYSLEPQNQVGFNILASFGIGGLYGKDEEDPPVFEEISSGIECSITAEYDFGRMIGISEFWFGIRGKYMTASIVSSLGFTLLTHYSFVTYQSFYHLEKYKEWDIPKPKVYVPHPARTELFTRKGDIGDMIIAGGRLIPKKGLDRIVKNVDNIHIFGDGPLRDELRAMNQTNTFTGNLNGDELRDLFESGWLYLFPAIITPDKDSEGISNTIKEALLMELQVICTPIAGNKELKNVIHLEDWSNIKEFIDTVPKVRNTNGRKEILDIYSPEKCVDRLLDGIETYV